VTRPATPGLKPAVSVTSDDTIWRDEARWKIDQTKKLSSVPANDQAEASLRVQILVGEEILYALLSEPTVENPNPGANLSAFRDKHALRIWNFLGNSSLLFGRIPGDGGKPLWDILTSASSLEVLSEPETIDGHFTWIVHSRGPHGIHRIWFDPESGGLPRRIEIRKGIGDLYQDEQIGSRPDESEPKRRSKAGEVTFNRSRQAIVVQYDQFELKKLGDQFVIMGFDACSEETSEKDVRNIAKAKYRIRSFERQEGPWPIDPIQFDIPIAEGIPVGIFENAPLEFGRMSATRYADWVDGKLRDRPEN
jgi:hypothetical protein